MKNLLYALSGIFTGAGGGLVVEQIHQNYPNIGWWLLGAGIILFLFLWIDPIKRKWPGREKWHATSSYWGNDPQNVINRGSWRSFAPQKEGNWFSLNFGNERCITQINLETDQYWVEKPETWQIVFWGKNPNMPKGKPKNGNGFIFLEEKDIPNPIQSFTVYIKEPAKDMLEGSNYARLYGQKVFWTISDIKIKERILHIFGKNIEHEL